MDETGITNLAVAIIERALLDYQSAGASMRKILRSQFERGLVRHICDSCDGYALFIEHLDYIDKGDAENEQRKYTQHDCQRIKTGNTTTNGRS